jgi:hypothetical protein
VLAEKIGTPDAPLEEKAANLDYKERLMSLAKEIRQLAKELRDEKAAHEATEEEAPWQALIDQAEEVARGRRRKTRRGVDGEVLDEDAD